MKQSKLEETIKEIFERGSDEMYWALEEHRYKFPPASVLKELLSLLETREREARAEGYNDGYTNGKREIGSGKTEGTTYTREGKAL